MRISDWSSDVCSSDLLCGCAGRRQKRVEHAFLSELHPYLAPKAGGWTLVDGDGERAADVFLAPIGREILIEIVAQHGYRAVYDNAAQRIIENTFSACMPLSLFYLVWRQAILGQRQVLAAGRAVDRKS